MAWIVSRFSFLPSILISFLVVLLSISSAQAGLLDSLIQDEPKFLPVGEAFPYSIEQQGSQLSVMWDSADEYYLYKKKVHLKQGKQKTKTSQFSEDGILKHDEAFGEVIVFYGQVEATFDLNQLNPNTPTILGFQGCADAGLCYPPQKIELDIDWAAVKASPTNTSSTNTDKTITTTADSKSSTTTPIVENESWIEGKSWLSVVGLFFILGLGLTFTPCVLPMVPILTSIVIG
ncbi:hypothetical protein A9R00_10070, partial [Oleispira antarctica]